MWFYARIKYIEANWVEIKFVVGGWSEKQEQVLKYRVRPKWDLERTMNHVNSHFAHSCEWAHFRIKTFRFYKPPGM